MLFLKYIFSAVKGKTPQVGDRVLVEAVYNPNMPFKWNAQRIQTLPQLGNQSVRTFRVCTKLDNNIFKIQGTLLIPKGNQSTNNTVECFA